MKSTPSKLEQAFVWIVHLLHENAIPFQVTGGFAAHIYGSNRPVNDIDFDVPEEYIATIASLASEYVVYGPVHHKDEKWDLDVVTLDYHGQEIDLGGAYHGKIFDDQKKKWIPVRVRLEHAEKKEVFGVVVPVVDPHDLYEYKQYLNGEHQEHDRAALKAYLKKI